MEIIPGFFVFALHWRAHPARASVFDDDFHFNAVRLMSLASLKTQSNPKN
jgi:hypothetical protein